MNKRRYRARRAVGLVLLTMLLALAVPTPAGASEAVEDSSLGQGTIRNSGRYIPVPPTPYSRKDDSDPFAMWTWRTGRRAFFLHNTYQDRTRVNGTDVPPYHSTLDAVQIDTGEVVGTVPLTKGAQNIVQQSVAVDEDGARLFVPYFDPSALPQSPIRPQTVDQFARPSLDPLAGSACLSVTQVHTCVTGFHIIDGRTLEVVGNLPLRNVSVDGLVPTAFTLWATSYAPPRVAGEGAKLLALVAEDGIPESRPGGTGGTDGGDWRTQTGTHVWYAVQLDVDSGRMDWSVRVEGCRALRNYRDGQTHIRTRFRSWGATIFRTAGSEDSAVVAGCSTGTAQQAVLVRIPLDSEGMAAQLPLKVTAPTPQTAESGSAPVSQATPQRVFSGPDKVTDFLHDPGSGRVVLRVVDGSPRAEVYWVFDTKMWAVVGTVGIGTIVDPGWSTVGLDPVTGRLYVLLHPRLAERAGLYVADIRRNPLPQALFFPGFDELWIDKSGNDPHSGTAEMTSYPILSGQAADGTREIYVANGVGNKAFYGSVASRWAILHDGLPVSEDAQETNEYSGRTLDLNEVPGVTDAAFDGVARGYAARALLVGGVEGAARLGPVDAPGAVLQIGEFPTTRELGGETSVWVDVLGDPGSPCSGPNREIVVGAVGLRQPAIVDVSGSRGGAQPLWIDSGTTPDLEAPVSRCTGEDWDALWATALFGRAPVEEQGVEVPEETRPTGCLSTDDQPSDATGDPVAGLYAARVTCEEEDASGYAYARAVPLPGGAAVAEALSTFRVYRDPGRGIVSRVESVARGFSIPGVIGIDMVRGVAESWANGRQFSPPVVEEGQVYDANCDLERTAGTCFQRHVFGVRTPAYTCGPCGDERALVDGLSRGLGQYGTVKLRNPDPRLARGADNGFTAAITKPELERFPDLVLHNDLLQTVLPTLEIVRQAPPNRHLTGGGPAGRQIFQLAGVEVSSSYGIQCLLVYDEESNTCGAPVEPPGAITVSLQDSEGEPLAGGAFEVRQDVDADGVLGLVDTLLPDGACVTAEDGVGTCSFEELQPGAYLVSQVAAPPGYAKSDEPFVVELASGEQRTVAFTNVSNVSTIELTAQDENGGPLSGATFAAYPDPDADGKVAPDAQPAATCTTDASGACTMQVPAGSYVLVQTAAPGGLEGIEPVPFTFASGGQVAAVTITNYPPETAGVAAPPQAPSPVYTPPVGIAPPVESIDPGYTPPVDEPEVAPGGGVIDSVGGTVVQVIRAPGDALRLLSRDPKQAVAWTAALALFVLAVMAIRRRQQAMALID